MTVSVVEIATSTVASTNNQSATLSNTPAAGDVVLVILPGSVTRTASTVSGLGGTWTIDNTEATGLANSCAVAWSTDANASGAVSVTYSATGNGAVRVYLIRGLSSPTVTLDSTRQLSSTALLTGPTTSATSGDIVIDAFSNNTSAANTTWTRTGYTDDPLGVTSNAGNSTTLGSAYVIPGSTNTYGTTTQTSISRTSAITQVKVASVAGSYTGTASLAGTGAISTVGTVDRSSGATLAGAGTVTTAGAVPSSGPPITDDFNRSNSTSSLGVTSVGSVPWVQHTGTWGISSNSAYVSNGVSGGICTATVATGVSDCIVSAVATVPSGDVYMGFVVRSDGAGNDYLIQFDVGDTWVATIYKRTAGVASTLASASTLVSTGSVISVELSGSSIVIKDDGVTITSTTDSTWISQTRHGMYIATNSGSASGGTLDDFSVTLAGSLDSGATRTGTGSITAAGAVSGSRGASIAGAGTITATGVALTSLDPWTSGAGGEAILNLEPSAGVLEVTYEAEAAPAAIVEVPLKWQSHETATIGGDTSGMTEVNLGVPHVWVDGVDVTYFRDVPCKIGGWRQESPFGWTGTTLTFPQVFHYEERGTGDLAWMYPDAPVEIAIVKAGGERIHRFTGHLASDDPGTGRGRTESVWGVEGALWQADHVHHPVPSRLDPTDIGTLIPAELNGTPSRRFSPIPNVSTGIVTRKRGAHGQTRWEWVTDTLSTALQDDGDLWTIEPTGPRSFAMVLKDTETVHWTITAGAPGVELDLSNDHHERIDAVYGRGVGPDGYAWANLFFPDLLPYDPPDYPYSDPDQNVLLGDTDAMTLTGTGISDWQRRIRDLGYTSLAVDGVINSADIAAVRWIQGIRGIQVDGFLGPQTWAATWNIGAVGGNLRTVRLPLAVRPEVEQFLYGANGATVGTNPVYDPSIIRHEVDIDFGANVRKEGTNGGREMARRILERGLDPGITGTVKLTTCPWEGSRWEMNAGENVLIKGVRGEDVLCRIVALDAEPESLTVTLTVDSEFRDAMAVAQILERNRESKADPARRPGNPNRRSRLDQDQVTPFEGESPAGRIPRMALFEGLWTVWPVPVSEIGIVAKLRFKTSGPASKFAIAVFGRDITANQIAAKVPNPLAVPNPWNVGDAWLDSHAFIDGWGEEGQAAGYGMLGSESDGDPVTGELYDDAGFPYVSAIPPWVWVAMYSPTSCYIEGRLYPDPVQ